MKVIQVLLISLLTFSCKSDNDDIYKSNGWNRDKTIKKVRDFDKSIKNKNNLKVLDRKKRINKLIDLNTPSNIPLINNPNQGNYSSMPTDMNVLSITFDDGPHGVNTPRLLNILSSRNIKATFYVVGENVKLYPRIIERMVRDGHEIGNHTYTHPSLTKLSMSRVESEVTRTAQLIYQTSGIYPRTIRPPFGAINLKLKNFFKEKYGYSTIMWSVDPNDWRRPGVSVVARRILTRARPGAIILVHDIHKSSVDAMPRVLDGLLNKGYKFLTVSQLIKI